MSLVVEGPSSVTWKGVRVPREYGEWTYSPLFRMGSGEWKLSCRAFRLSIRLYICLPPGSPRPVPLSSVSVRVEGGDGEEPGPEELCEEEKDVRVRPGSWSYIWCRHPRDVERLLPEFLSDRRLTFRVAIGREGGVKRPRTGATSAAAQPSTSPCPRPKRRRTFSSASVQTCLSGQNFRPSADPSVHPSRISVTCACLESLSEDLSRMLEADSSGTDVELRCEGHTTRAHKNVLCSRSEVLAKMLNSDMVEGRTGVVDIKDTDADTFRRFLRFLYTGRVDDGTLTFESALRLYEVGDLYAVHSLKRHCSDFLVAHLTVENACDALVVADSHSEQELVEMVTMYILENEIPQTSDRWPDFCDRNPALAMKLLNRIVRR